MSEIVNRKTLKNFLTSLFLFLSWLDLTNQQKHPSNDPKYPTHHIWWESSNPIFTLDRPYPGEVRYMYPFETLQFHCAKRSKEVYWVYWVDVESFSRCQLKASSKFAFSCGDPRRQKLNKQLIVPKSGGGTFKVGRNYFLISTSTGDDSGKNNRQNGACFDKSRRLQMKMMFVLRNRPKNPNYKIHDVLWSKYNPEFTKAKKPLTLEVMFFDKVHIYCPEGNYKLYWVDKDRFDRCKAADPSHGFSSVFGHCKAVAAQWNQRPLEIDIVHSRRAGKIQFEYGREYFLLTRGACKSANLKLRIVVSTERRGLPENSVYPIWWTDKNPFFDSGKQSHFFAPRLTIDMHDELHFYCPKSIALDVYFVDNPRDHTACRLGKFKRLAFSCKGDRYADEPFAVIRIKVSPSKAIRRVLPDFKRGKEYFMVPATDCPATGSVNKKHMTRIDRNDCLLCNLKLTFEVRNKSLGRWPFNHSAAAVLNSTIVAEKQQRHVVFPNLGISWNRKNPFFYQLRGPEVLVAPGAVVYFFCPEQAAEQYKVYWVDKDDFKACRITRTSRLAFTCSGGPNTVGEMYKRTFLIRDGARMGTKQKQVMGDSLYLTSTSSSTKKGLDKKVGGVCASLGLKLKLTIAQRAPRRASQVIKVLFSKHNTLFRRDRPLTVDVLYEEELTFQCPANEIYKAYWVNRKDYETCRIRPKTTSRSAFYCNGTASSVKYVITALRRPVLHAPGNPGGKTFTRGQLSYLISTSSGRAKGVNKTAGGACRRRNMFLRVNVIGLRRKGNVHFTTHEIFWSKVNQKFSYRYKLRANRKDKLRIYCPKSESGEVHQAYWVNRQNYEKCRIDDKRSQLAFRCLGTSMRPTDVHARTTEPGQIFYIISTSTGDLAGLNNTSGGACKSHGMRLRILIGQNYIVRKKKVFEVWATPRNPKFNSYPHYTIRAQIGDVVDFYCPKETSNIGLNFYWVTKEEFMKCIVVQKSHFDGPPFVCQGPNSVYKYEIDLSRNTRANFKPGNSYYLMSPSILQPGGIGNRAGGVCATANLRVRINVQYPTGADRNARASVHDVWWSKLNPGFRRTRRGKFMRLQVSMYDVLQFHCPDNELEEVHHAFWVRKADFDNCHLDNKAGFAFSCWGSRRQPIQIRLVDRKPNMADRRFKFNTSYYLIAADNVTFQQEGKKDVCTEFNVRMEIKIDRYRGSPDVKFESDLHRASPDTAANSNIFSSVTLLTAAVCLYKWLVKITSFVA